MISLSSIIAIISGLFVRLMQYVTNIISALYAQTHFSYKCF